MRCGACLLFASLLVAGCAEGEKNVEFTPVDTGPEAVVDTGQVEDVREETCVPAGGVTCTTFPQCGCISSENCNVTAPTGTTACVKAGSDGLHETCTGSGECQRGMQCISNVCVPFCATEADCTMPGTPRCKKVTEGATVCLAQCDVQNPTAVCGPNTTCFFTGDADTTQCAAAGLATGKGGCTSNKYACAPGFLCVNNADCFRWCRMGVATDCISGQTCTAQSPKAMKGTVEYGVCAY